MVALEWNAQNSRPDKELPPEIKTILEEERLAQKNALTLAYKDERASLQLPFETEFLKIVQYLQSSTKI